MHMITAALVHAIPKHHRLPIYAISVAVSPLLVGAAWLQDWTADDATQKMVWEILSAVMSAGLLAHICILAALLSGARLWFVAADIIIVTIALGLAIASHNIAL